MRSAPDTPFGFWTSCRRYYKPVPQSLNSQPLPLQPRTVLLSHILSSASGVEIRVWKRSRNKDSKEEGNV